MSWFKRLRLRLRDMRTLNKLGLAAETEAADMNELPPGAEHYVLAAMKMPDGTARQVFEQLGANPDGFRNAIRQQYDDALRAVGMEPVEIDPTETGDDAGAPKPRLYQARPDVSTVFANMKAFGDERPDQSLLGARVLIAVAQLERGVSERALKAMGIDPNALIEVAENVLSKATR